MPEATPPSPARLVAAVLPAAALPLAGAVIYFDLFAGESWARWVYVLVKLFTLVWPLVAVPLLLGRRLPRIDWSRPAHRAAVAPGLAFGGLVIVATLGLMATPLGEQIAAHAERIHHKVTQLGVLEHYLLFALFLSVVHSALEEYYWRWFLFGTLRRHLSLAAAVTLASLAFAAHHAVVLSQYFPFVWAAPLTVAVALGGAVWCLMYERQKSLVGAWLSHVLVDLAVLWVGYRLLF